MNGMKKRDVSAERGISLQEAVNQDMLYILQRQESFSDQLLQSVTDDQLLTRPENSGPLSYGEGAGEGLKRNNTRESITSSGHPGLVPL